MHRKDFLTFRKSAIFQKYPYRIEELAKTTS